MLFIFSCKCPDCLCTDNLSSHAIEVLARTKLLKPARPAFLVTVHFLEAEEYEFCTSSVFKCLQGMLYRIRWNPALDADHFYCFPSKALININYSSSDAKGIHSQAVAVLCPSCLKTPGMQHCLCKDRIQLTAKLGLEKPGKCCPVIKPCNIGGRNSCCRYV